MHKPRKHIRWRQWDCGADAGYFITICTKNRLPYFGRIHLELLDTKHIIDPERILDLHDLTSYLVPSAAGQIAFQLWQEIPQHYPFVKIDTVVFMPNHIHGILIFDKASLECPRHDEERTREWQTNQFGRQKDNLATVVGSYKSAVTRSVRKVGDEFAWQTRYYDRVLRNQSEYQTRIRYMWKNPIHWREDDLFV